MTLRKMYKYVTTLESGLHGLEHIRFGRQLWIQTKVRKGHKCVVTGKGIKRGHVAYRPMANAGNRADRISCDGMLELI